MKTAVIAPVGMSPPAISTLIDGIGVPVTDCILLATKNPAVQASVGLLTTGLHRRFPWMRIHHEVLPFEDIGTEEETFAFITQAARIIRQEQETFGCDHVYLSISGGRKNMCVSLSLLAPLLQTDGVFHVINTEINVVNTRLEHLRKDIEAFATADDDERNRLYEEKSTEYDHLLFPPRDTYEVIRIPTLPYPPDHLHHLILGLTTGEALTSDERDLLARHGILEPGRSSTVLTPYGERFLAAFLGRP
ncbi:CRISPR-associated protein Csx14 [Methanofollis formosanus]|uniref:CRISPR-associated protein Csx14 n=1 Tax=Methanofollis formosanus TaxID=299308 RepID=A0A8G0ZWX9_9EURY|nr:CRISPR-associated protein Csx14 [Methanofollis formosanus]QYZ78199.1 CRISPR-associated protein Csx14 [Methanofollis formosanus]